MKLDISFSNWKKLTSLLADEGDTYDALIDRLINKFESSFSDEINNEVSLADISSGGAYFKGVFLPNWTKLRATYKGKIYNAEIRDNCWIDQETGMSRRSPSEAAFSITNSGVNGWLFWDVKRPSDLEWRGLNALRK